MPPSSQQLALLDMTIHQLRETAEIAEVLPDHRCPSRGERSGKPSNKKELIRLLWTHYENVDQCRRRKEIIEHLQAFRDRERLTQSWDGTLLQDDEPVPFAIDDFRVGAVLRLVSMCQRKDPGPLLAEGRSIVRTLAADRSFLPESDYFVTVEPEDGGQGPPKRLCT